jgi:predicted ATP-grasp superfamily ATP-dependent carboligase
MSTVLVTDGEERSALAVVRSLARAGHHVLVTSAAGRSLAGASRFCTEDVPVPAPLEHPDAYTERIARIVSQEAVDIVLPVTEGSALALLPRRAALAPARIPMPDASTFEAICDKERVLAAAREVGLSAPGQTVICRKANGSLLKGALARLTFPVVLKPARSVVNNGDGRAKTGVAYARNTADLEAKLGAIPAAAYPIMVQQRIEGPGVGIFLLVWNGEVRAIFAHRRIREKPPSGGVSVYRESVILDDSLIARSVALLRQFDWQGVAMVEYKINSATGEPYLMEINGRFWGSLQLAIDAGVDFPRLLVDAALGVATPPATDYRVGVRSRWEWGDVDHLIGRFRNGDALLPRGTPTRWRTLRQVLVPWRPGDRPEVFRPNDPFPFLRESAIWIRNVTGGVR